MVASDYKKIITLSWKSGLLWQSVAEIVIKIIMQLFNKRGATGQIT